ncbi:MAG: Unknown protein [uncultured Sulfurovum sp.]|uniref:PD-(D/E)XK motif protein n=1 Tax=uncultured Sulfurovum sp. TaxID=269237 RepID=A0A6S6TG68_9BACT|nr:MAG: Unknown protein [uncultured Sulfurovum sp.]
MKINPWNKIQVPSAELNLNVLLADKESPLEFYWGRDSSTNLLFILHTTLDVKNSEKVPKLNGIKITIGKVGKTYQLILTLTSKEDKDIFYTLCMDLLASTKGINDENIAIDVLLKRLEKWQYFLKNSRNLIDKKQLKGLIGELFFLHKYLLKNFEVDEALSFWKAPLQSVQDFELNNMAIEVKTKASMNAITISSFEQLFTTLDELYLFVLTLTDATKKDKSSFNIYDLIKEIRDLIGLENLDKFNHLLLLYGFLELSEYEELYFKISIDEFYEVIDGFPRISKIPQSIENLTYRVNLDACKEFLVKEDFLRYGVENE